MQSINLTDEQAEKASKFISAISNTMRISLVKTLLRAEQNVGDLSLFVGMSQSSTSQHLAVLKQAGILKQRRDRQIRYCTINPQMAPIVKRLIGIAEATERKK